MVDFDNLVNGPVAEIFGQPVRFMPATTKPFDGAGDFREAYVDVEPGGGMSVTTSGPMLSVRLAQFQHPPLQGDRLTIKHTGETFVIKEVRSDGLGWAKLMLNFDSQRYG